MTTFISVSIYGNIFQLLPRNVKVYFHGNHDFSINLECCMQFLKFSSNKLFWQYFKMTVLTCYHEIFFKFSQGIPRSTFIETIVLASTSDGRIFASLRMFSLSPLSNDCIKCAACILVSSLLEKIDNSFFTKLDLLCKVLLPTLLLSLYAIGVDDSARGWKYEIECLYEVYECYMNVYMNAYISRVFRFGF